MGHGNMAMPLFQTNQTQNTSGDEAMSGVLNILGHCPGGQLQCG